MTWAEFVELPPEYEWPLLTFVASLLEQVGQMPNVTEQDQRAREEAWRSGIRAFEEADR